MRLSFQVLLFLEAGATNFSKWLVEAPEIPKNKESKQAGFIWVKRGYLTWALQVRPVKTSQTCVAREGPLLGATFLPGPALKHHSSSTWGLCSSVGENTRELTVNMAACQVVAHILFVLFFSNTVSWHGLKNYISSFYLLSPSTVKSFCIT